MRLSFWCHDLYPSQSAVVVSRQALEGWLSRRLTKAKDEKSPPVTGNDTLGEVTIMPDILCQHGALDPQKAHNMKRVSKVHNCNLIRCST